MVERVQPEGLLERLMAREFMRPITVLVLDPEAGPIKGPDALVGIVCRTWSDFVRCQRKFEIGDYKAPHTGLSPNTQLLAHLAVDTGVLVGKGEVPRDPTMPETAAPAEEAVSVKTCSYAIREPKRALCGEPALWNVLATLADDEHPHRTQRNDVWGCETHAKLMAEGFKKEGWTVLGPTQYESEAGKLLKQVIETPIHARGVNPRGLGTVGGEATAERSRRRVRESCLRATVTVGRHSHINHCGFVVKQHPVKLCASKSRWNYQRYPEEEIFELCDQHKQEAETAYPEAAFAEKGRQSLVEVVLARRSCRMCSKPSEVVVRIERHDAERPIDQAMCLEHANEYVLPRLAEGLRVTFLTKETAELWKKD